MLNYLILASTLLITSNFASPTLPSGQSSATQPAAMVRYLDHIVPSLSTTVTVQMPMASDLAVEEREMVARVNDERTSRGLNALDVDPLLVTVARSHSEEMHDRNYFDHHSPTAGITTPMDRYLKWLHADGNETPSYLIVGENIFYSSEFDNQYNVAYAHQALMNSPGHRANILDPRYSRIGIGTYRDAKGEFWVTELFVRDTK